MKPGDLVKHKCSPDSREPAVQYGTFVGLRTFGGNTKGNGSYTCAEVMWHNKAAPNGDIVSTVQTNLIEVVQ